VARRRALRLLPERIALAEDRETAALPVDRLARERRALRNAKAGVEERPNHETLFWLLTRIGEQVRLFRVEWLALVRILAQSA